MRRPLRVVERSILLKARCLSSDSALDAGDCGPGGAFAPRGGRLRLASDRLETRDPQPSADGRWPIASAAAVSRMKCSSAAAIARRLERGERAPD